MIAIVTLGTTNTDLDAEESFTKRAKAKDRKLERKLLKKSTSITIIHEHHEQSNDTNAPKVKAKDTEHMKMYQQIMNYFSFFGKFVGVIYRYDWVPKNQVMFWIVNLLFPFAWFSVFYTQFIHIRNGDYIRILELFAIYGLMISVLQYWLELIRTLRNCVQKFCGYILHRFRMLPLLYSVSKLCRENIVGSRADIIKSGLDQMLLLLKIFGMGALACVGFFVSVPVKLFVIDNKWVPLVPLEIIFCDQSTLSGFIGANIVQGIMGILAAFGSMLYGASFIVIICSYSIHVDLICEDFKQLDLMWRDTSTTVPVAYRHGYLRNICIKRQDMNGFMDKAKEIYETKFFIYFCFNYFSQIICLYQITVIHWISGYALAVGLFLEMMFYCAMGTKLTTANEKLCAIICDSKWYTYDLLSQRLILMLLIDSQNTSEITLGSIGPLNLVTFITIVKSIYSYYTVLTELF